MKYLCLIYENEKAFETIAPAEGEAIMNEYFTFTSDIQKNGKYVAGEALQPTNTATTVRVNNFGSLVLHAGSRVRMLPGFHVDAGGYARAEIGTCNGTAIAPTAPAAAGVVEGLPVIDLSYEQEGY